MSKIIINIKTSFLIVIAISVSYFLFLKPKGITVGELLNNVLKLYFNILVGLKNKFIQP